MSSAILRKLLFDIEPYLKRSDINEVILNAPGLVLLDLGGEKWEFVKDKKITPAFLKNFPEQLATESNQQFNERIILLSTAIPGTNNRVTAVHNSLLRSPTNSNEISIRIQKNKKFQLHDFIKELPKKFSNTHKELFDENDSLEAKIKAIMTHQSNVLISGGTGSGKTSLFNALIDLIPANHRIVTLEDSPELSPPHKNKTQLLVSKSGSNLSGASYEDMINICMRLRPTNLLLGEIDTRNTAAFLRLANTGHDGMIATLHADTTHDSVQALISNLTYAGNSLPLDGMYNAIESAIDYVIQIYKHQIVEVRSMKQILKEIRR
jgi:type IV secretion system protein VirB11